MLQLNALSHYISKKAPIKNKEDGTIPKISVMSVGFFCCMGKKEEYIQTIFDIATFHSHDPKSEPVALHNNELGQLIDCILLYAIANCQPRIQDHMSESSLSLLNESDRKEVQKRVLQQLRYSHKEQVGIVNHLFQLEDFIDHYEFFNRLTLKDCEWIFDENEIAQKYVDLFDRETEKFSDRTS